MTKESQVVGKRERHLVRANHAKSSACVIGGLVVAPEPPLELAQGLFAEARRHPVAVRFARGPGAHIGDRVSTHRGVSIKVFEVEGGKLPGHDAATPMPEVVKDAASPAARSHNKPLNAWPRRRARLPTFAGTRSAI